MGFGDKINNISILLMLECISVSVEIHTEKHKAKICLVANLEPKYFFVFVSMKYYGNTVFSNTTKLLKTSTINLLRSGHCWDILIHLMLNRLNIVALCLYS